ncbi:twitchin isoform X1 [Lepeophtheirus salmonis]|uniref:twitchin isoform X1 n=3 Tax=Lepeophtheirus salmonis TaxID=72036 RepID=UPI003AF3E73A
MPHANPLLKYFKQSDKKPELKPPEDAMKSGERKASLVLSDGLTMNEDVEWENESIPLRPEGKVPKLVNPQDKWSCGEGDNGYVIFQIEGDPLPEIQWFKGFKDLSVEPRYKTWTNGVENTIILGIHSARQEEEGDYKVLLKNRYGEHEFEFKYFVTVEGGMDFRAMLLKRKKVQRKVEVKVHDWIETPVDQEVQENKVDKVVLTARLSIPNVKGKWYLRNAASLRSIKSTDYGLELHKSERFEWIHREDSYTLIVHNPTIEESGKFTLVAKTENQTFTTGGHVEVIPPDPEFYFEKKLMTKKTGLTNRSVKFNCILNEAGANIRWTRNGAPLPLHPRYERSVRGEKLGLVMNQLELDDAGVIGVEILEYVKDGEDDVTSCKLIVEEYPHKFTSKLKSSNVVEGEDATFEIDVEADDADVSWFHNGKKIFPDDKRFSIVTDGKKRKLVLRNAGIGDAGEITCATNKDSSSSTLRVAHDNKFVSEVSSQNEGVERESYVFNVQVKDPSAPVDFFLNGKIIVPGADTRMEVKQMGDGKHQLIVHYITMEDYGQIEARTPTNHGDKTVSCTGSFNVIMGEKAPKLGDCGPVSGVAHKDCNWGVSYAVEGYKQSDIELSVFKDGKEVKVGQDVNINFHGDRVDLNVINPKREKSGSYKIIIRNAQGFDERLINVNIMDKPDPPKTIEVTDISKNSCVVKLSPPDDDGGTEIKHYIIEAIDVSSSSNQWSQVAQADGKGPKSIKVNNLINKHRYRFRARAANRIGLSDPHEISGQDIIIKDPWDEPDKPGRPSVLDWSSNSCDLAWALPESDGGAPITHYEIEYKEKSMGLWQQGEILNTSDIEIKTDVNGKPMVHGTCKGLVEGNEYVFRIKAVNKGGASLPSETSDSVLAKTRYLKPFLHQPGIYNIEIKKGRTFRYDIWFGGEPAPSVTWERNGSLLLGDSDRISIELFSKKTVYCEKNTVLTVTKANRSIDTGHYTIKLLCDGGTQQATGYVNVLDVPEKPRHLNPDEIRAEHINLSWATPHDDGGTPITSYVIKMMDIDSGDWLVAMETKDTKATVKGLKPGHIYQFEVIAVNKEGESEPCRTLEPIKAENPYKPPSEPKEPNIVDFDNQSVTLRWQKPSDDGGRPITHYIIQKKDKFGGWFDALKTDDASCEARIDELEARIPGLSEGKWYQFRIIAVNKAGESSPSFETKPHLCRHKNLTPSIDKGSSSSKTIKVNRTAIWQIKVKGEPPPEFTWYKNGIQIASTDEVLITREEYQGGATAKLCVSKSQMIDAGTYSLVAENRNGQDKTDLDLIVLDLMQECECDMFKTGDLECNCSNGFRHGEVGGKHLLEIDFGNGYL